MLELYHHGSSACAAKTRFALEEKRLEWQGHVVDIFRGEQFKPEFLALNPKAVVPVMVHDGFVLAESTVICEYVEDVFADHPVFPREARARAQVRLWTKAEVLHFMLAGDGPVGLDRRTSLDGLPGDTQGNRACFGIEACYGVGGRSAPLRPINQSPVSTTR
ncbi:MAG: glutathione S-transferase N-terminal domain-containing protein [Gammaproteobacteria bacterium]